MASPLDLHRIFFTLEYGLDFACRTWPSVPRVGEHVMFNSGEGIRVFEVKRVVWNSAPDDDHGAPTVNVTIAPEAE